MSAVRMCDRCKTIFSELEDGWQTFTATTVKRRSTGEATEVVQRMDACPSCALTPRPQFERELEAAKLGDEQAARIARLEREVGIGGPASVRAGDTIEGADDEPPPAA